MLYTAVACDARRSTDASLGGERDLPSSQVVDSADSNASSAPLQQGKFGVLTNNVAGLPKGLTTGARRTRSSWGQLTDMSQFWTDAATRKLAENRLRYLVARWSHAENLFAWELFNELWLKGSADYLRSIDVRQHLITVSLQGNTVENRNAVWSLPNIDVVQKHHYFSPDPAPDLPALIAEADLP